jgi:hypothetical protein
MGSPLVLQEAAASLVLVAAAFRFAQGILSILRGRGWGAAGWGSADTDVFGPKGRPGPVKKAKADFKINF